MSIYKSHTCWALSLHTHTEPGWNSLLSFAILAWHPPASASPALRWQVHASVLSVFHFKRGCRGFSVLHACATHFTAWAIFPTLRYRVFMFTLTVMRIWLETVGMEIDCTESPEVGAQSPPSSRTHLEAPTSLSPHFPAFGIYTYSDLNVPTSSPQSAPSL